MIRQTVYFAAFGLYLTVKKTYPYTLHKKQGAMQLPF